MDFFNTLSGTITTDVIIIFSVFALLFYFSLRYGKSAIISLIITLYIGILTFLSFPYLEEATLLKSSEAQITLSHIAIFLIFILIIQKIMLKVIFTEYSSKKFVKYIEVGLLSGTSTMLIMAFAYHTIPLVTLYDFGDSIDSLFSSQYFFWWLIAPIIVISFTSRQ